MDKSVMEVKIMEFGADLKTGQKIRRDPHIK
jgi:hypothetical protein